MRNIKSFSDFIEMYVEGFFYSDEERIKYITKEFVEPIKEQTNGSD